MALLRTIEGIRSTILKSLHGRLLGIDDNERVLGPKGYLTQVAGFSSAGSSLTSTDISIPNYGVTVLGTTASSGTTVGSTSLQVMDYPYPSLQATLINTTTGYTTIVASTGSYFATTASSTYAFMTFLGKGVNAMLIGESTDRWRLLNGPALSTTDGVKLGNPIGLV